MKLSHNWRRGAAAFDDENLVSCAGLVPVMELAQQTGLSNLIEEHVAFRCERIRLRAGKAGSGKGAASMITEAINTAKALGARNILCRGDSAFGNGKVIAARGDAAPPSGQRPRPYRQAPGHTNPAPTRSLASGQAMENLVGQRLRRS